MHASRPQGLPIDDYIAIASFVFFGVKAIIDAAQIDDDGAGIAEESEEASETLQKSGLYGRAAPAAPLAAPPPVGLPPAHGSVHGAGGVTHVVPLLLPTCEPGGKRGCGRRWDVSFRVAARAAWSLLFFQCGAPDAACWSVPSQKSPVGPLYLKPAPSPSRPRLGTAPRSRRLCAARTQAPGA